MNTVAVQSEKPEHDPQLEFTGNWFIDAGILGFVNLMEEVYGWDLETLQKKIQENEDLVYYGYFPLAFVYDNLGVNSISTKQTLNDKWAEFSQAYSDAKSAYDFVWKEYVHNICSKAWIRHKLFHQSELRILESMQGGRGISKEEFADDGFIKKLRGIVEVIDDLNSDKRKVEYIESQKVLPIKKRENQKTVVLTEEDFQSINERIEILADSEVKKHLRPLCDRYSDTINYLEELWQKRKNETEIGKNDKFFRIPLRAGNLTNFLMFNSGASYEKQKTHFFSLISFNQKENELKGLKRSINKLLISPKKFPNIPYCELIPSTIFEEKLKYIFAYILCSQRCFLLLRSGSILFYTNDLPVAHDIYKRLKAFQKRTESIKLFYLPWDIVIDRLIEKKALWNLRDMYVLEFGRYERQEYKSVHYLGVSALNASILIDDNLRVLLNKQLPCNEHRKQKNFLLIKELLNGKPLFPFVFEHVCRCIKDNENKVYLSPATSLYALMIDANKQKLDLSKRHFQAGFFKGYPDIVERIKKDVNYASYAANAFKDCLSEGDQKIYVLLDAVRGNNRNQYLNVVYRLLIENENAAKNSIVSNYLFKNVIQNERSWQPYGLALLLQVVKQWKQRKKKIQ